MPPVLLRAIGAALVVSIVPAVASAGTGRRHGKLAEFLAPEPGRTLCVARRYDDDHLRAHPRQRSPR